MKFQAPIRCRQELKHKSRKSRDGHDSAKCRVANDPWNPWNTPGMELTPGNTPGTPWNGKLPLEKYQKTPQKRFFEIEYY